MNEDWPEYVAQRLVSLVSLTIDYEYMTIRTFDLIGANFSHLRHLSVSNAKITDITIISQLTNLEVLVLYRLNISHGNINALAQLHNLRHLDISREMVTNEHTHRAHSNLAIGLHRKSVRAIRNGTEIPWPEMRRINLSGLKVAQFANDNGESVKDIIMAYPKLEQIVLVGMFRKLILLKFKPFVSRCTTGSQPGCWTGRRSSHQRISEVTEICIVPLHRFGSG